jgi:hypothetical protein
MGKHKSTEKRSYIPQQNSHADIKRRLERMKYPMGRVQQSDQTLEEAMGTEEYLEFAERQKNRSK